MKKIAIQLVFILVSATCIAQTNSEKARDAYKTAFEAYNKGNYQVSIDNLENAITLLGTTKVLIQDLLVKSYVGLKGYRQAKAEAEKYFALNPPQDEGYSEMLLISSEIDKQIEILAREQRLKEADQAGWNTASAKNTREGYEQYLGSYPKGTNVKNANDRIEQIDWSTATNKYSKIAYQKYIRLHPQGPNVETARRKITDFEKDEKLRSSPNSYFMNAVKSKDFDLVMKLAEYGADVNKSEIHYETDKYPTYLTALWQGRNMYPYHKEKLLGYLETLFKHGGDPNQRYDYDFDTECHYYVIAEYVNLEIDPQLLLEIIRLFVSSGLDVNAGGGQLLRYLAIEHNARKADKNYTAIFQFLLEKGADPYLSRKCFREQNKSFWDRDLSNYNNKYVELSAYKVATNNNKSDLILLFKKYKK